MNYYPRYPGDYLIKTVGISMIEDGAYTRLLDWYYSNEDPIQHESRYEVARATTTPAKEAVDKVLRRYFVRDDDVWRHGRADDEIAKARPRIETAKANGAKGGRKPKKNPPGNPEQNPAGNPPENPPGNPDRTQRASSPSPSPSPAPDVSSASSDLPPEGASGSRYGLMARRLMQRGIARASSGHIGFRALVDAGATFEEFDAYVDKALKANDPFLYLVSTVTNERQRAVESKPSLHRGALQAPSGDEGKRQVAQTAEWLREQAEHRRQVELERQERQRRKAAA